MNLIDFLNSSVANALGWTLLHAVWQGFALVLPIAVVLHLLRSRSSELRYQIGTSTLFSQLLVSAATFEWYYKPLTDTMVPVPAGMIMQTLPIHWQTIAQTLPWHQQLHLFLETHLSQFVLIYLIGIALFGVRLAGGWIYLQRLTKTAAKPATPIWMHLTDRLRLALAIRSVVRVRESARIAVPIVVGILKPVLLLPVGFVTSLTTREIEAVLAHELSHIKRHDYAVNLLQSVIEVLYFFHPALWWLSARVREEREHCCDDLAVQACGGDGRILAQALARVEELRLSQSNSAPALAMAFANRRQHLLHRVRRMLGVQTQPFISNGSLAGLTLATILLMSISVYAVQKQDKLTPRIHQPRPTVTRKHKIDNNSEYGMADNQKISYVVWKGQKLPASRVAKLQRQLKLVMSGQLSLDAVPQPDRDILLTIIEKNNAFDQGMDALSDGLAHIDYSNIVASALHNIPISPDGTVAGLANVNYDSIIHSAFASLPSLKPLSDSLNKQRAFHQFQMDSLSQLLAKRSLQMQTIQMEMEKFRFPFEELKRNQDVLNWRKDKLMNQRNALVEKHQRLLYNDRKQKLSQADVEKQLAALEPEIKKLEGNMEELTKQFEIVKAKEIEAQQPIDKLERESEQLEEQINKLAEEIGKQGDNIARMIPEHLERLERLEAPERPIRPARPPRPKIAPNAVRPPLPVAPLLRVSPAPAQKSAVTPKPEKPE